MAEEIARIFGWLSFLASRRIFFPSEFFFVSIWLGFASGIDWSAGPPDQSLIPQYVHDIYNITHSLIIFAVVFASVWLARQRPLWEMAAWGMHILMDIPTHSDSFFPTPFLWPLSSFHVNGIPWSHPIIFLPNVVLLGALYLWFFLRGRFRR